MDCKHEKTQIWEPHLAGARKCLACGMVYNPNRAYANKDPWFFEPPSLEEQIEDLKAKLAQSEEKRSKLRACLELIAAPKRSDGTYNRSREACEALARDALAPEEVRCDHCFSGSTFSALHYGGAPIEYTKGTCSVCRGTGFKPADEGGE